MTRMTLTRNMVLSAALLLSPLALADVLLIEPVREVANMDVPVNGMSMSEVESRFGVPNSKLAAVGDPPITRWVYERWSVFFEYDTVLYTVLHKGEVLGDEIVSPDSFEEESG